MAHAFRWGNTNVDLVSVTYLVLLLHCLVVTSWGKKILKKNVQCITSILRSVCRYDFYARPISSLLRTSVRSGFLSFLWEVFWNHFSNPLTWRASIAYEYRIKFGSIKIPSKCQFMFLIRLYLRRRGTRSWGGVAHDLLCEHAHSSTKRRQSR